MTPPAFVMQTLVTDSRDLAGESACLLLSTPRLAAYPDDSIPENANSRYAAHIVVVYLTTCTRLPASLRACESNESAVLCLYLIRRELMHYTTTRQQFLISPSHASLAQARTILITNIPKTMCTEGELRRWAGFVPGGVQNIWIYRDTRVRHFFLIKYAIFTTVYYSAPEQGLQ